MMRSLLLVCLAVLAAGCSQQPAALENEAERVALDSAPQAAAREEPEVLDTGDAYWSVADDGQSIGFGDDGTFPIHVECMSDAQRLPAGKTVRYALVVSVETAEQTSTTIHDEVRTRLRQQARERARGRVPG